MRKLNVEQFAAVLKEQRIKQRLTKELRFSPDNVDDWDDLDMVAVGTRSRAEGLLLIELSNLYVLPYELTAGLKDSTTGRSKPVICDFCYTWQRGGKAARITFRRTSDGHNLSYLCCGDLLCSLHVLDKTPEAALSRTQLHEDIAIEQRVARLKEKLQVVIARVGTQPVSIEPSEDQVFAKGLS